MCHGIPIGDIHRCQCRLTALGLYSVVKIFEAAHRPSNGKHVVFWGQRLGHGKPKAPRRSGDKSKLCHGSGVEGFHAKVKRCVVSFILSGIIEDRIDGLQSETR